MRLWVFPGGFSCSTSRYQRSVYSTSTPSSHRLCVPAQTVSPFRLGVGRDIPDSQQIIKLLRLMRTMNMCLYTCDENCIYQIAVSNSHRLFRWDLLQVTSLIGNLHTVGIFHTHWLMDEPCHCWCWDGNNTHWIHGMFLHNSVLWTLMT